MNKIKYRDIHGLLIDFVFIITFALSCMSIIYFFTYPVLINAVATILILILTAIARYESNKIHKKKEVK